MVLSYFSICFTLHSYIWATWFHTTIWTFPGVSVWSPEATLKSHQMLSWGCRLDSWSPSHCFHSVQRKRWNESVYFCTWERFRWSDAGVQCERRRLAVRRTVRVNRGSELVPCKEQTQFSTRTRTEHVQYLLHLWRQRSVPFSMDAPCQGRLRGGQGHWVKGSSVREACSWQ